MSVASGLFYVEIHPDRIDSWGKLELPTSGAVQKKPFSGQDLAFFEQIGHNSEATFTNPSKKDILIFVHGMRGDREPYFSEVLRQMQADYLDNPDCPIAQIIFLTWKSGKKHSYKSVSREAAPALATHFSTIFLKLMYFEKSVLRPKGCKLHLFGNSMAARLFSLSFEKIPENNFEYPLFSTLVLTAPDVESAEFSSRPAFRMLPKITERAYFFFNPKDNALRFAKWVNGQPMLGSAGPANDAILPKNVQFIEVKGVRNRTFAGKILRHTYYSHSPQVVQMIQKIWHEAK